MCTDQSKSCTHTYLQMIVYANVNFLLRKFSKCSINVKCYLFKTACSNLNCAPMWFDCTKTVLKY